MKRVRWGIGAAALLLAVSLVSSASADSNATIDFEGLGEGDIVSQLSSGDGISGVPISGSVGVTSDPDNRAMIFDGTCDGGDENDCSGDDPDLFAPALGNLLIVSEDGNSADPDDRAAGGTLEFDFTSFGPGSVTVKQLTIVDTEAGGTITFFLQGGGTDTELIPNIADGAIQVLNFADVDNVTSLHVEFDESGAVDNIEISVPDEQTGGEGCTPGYWKNHTDRWAAPYDTDDEFDDIFGVSSTNGPTLLEAAGVGGGGEYALQRHAVAALLNAANAGVDYAYSVSEVIDMVQDAYDDEEFEAVKELLEDANEEGCPLSGSPATTGGGPNKGPNANANANSQAKRGR